MRQISTTFHPGLEYVAIPAEYLEHSSLHDDAFFTVPEPLLDCLIQNVGRARFDADLLTMELAVTRACGGEDGVGFWNENRIQFPLLRFRPLEIDSEMGESLGWTDQQIETVNTLGRARDEQSANTARGYAGWLLTNRMFLTEHESILRTWQAEIKEYGIPLMTFVVPDATRVPGATSQPGSNMEQFIAAFEAFFVRWRLVGLAAPNLPLPLRPQMPVVILKSVLGHMRGGGQVFYMPDTFPVPTRDELRGMMEDALRGAGVPSHLAEWIANVRAGNSAKNVIARYARLFELQHYVRVLYQRHATALRQRKAAINEAFALFLRVSSETIAKDLAFIAERLGTEWYLAAPHSASQNP